jgi:hypothetical protein
MAALVVAEQADAVQVEKIGEARIARAVFGHAVGQHEYRARRLCGQPLIDIQRGAVGGL